MKKRKSTPNSFSFTGLLTDDHCPLGFPKGTILKGESTPFQAERAALRPCQVVATRNANGGTEARFCRSVARNKIVAVLHKVVLPMQATRPGFGHGTGGQRR